SAAAAHPLPGCEAARRVRAADWCRSPWERHRRAQRPGDKPYGDVGRMATLIEIPTLRTERLVLRAFRAGDLDSLAAMNADPNVHRFLYGGRQITRGVLGTDHESARAMGGARLRIVRGTGGRGSGRRRARLGVRTVRVHADGELHRAG